MSNTNIDRSLKFVDDNLLLLLLGGSLVLKPTADGSGGDLLDVFLIDTILNETAIGKYENFGNKIVDLIGTYLRRL